MLTDKEKMEYNEKVKARYSIIATKEFNENKISPTLPCRYNYYNEKLYCRWENCQEMTNRAFVVDLDYFRSFVKKMKPGLKIHFPYCDKHMEEYQVGCIITASKNESIIKNEEF